MGVTTCEAADGTPSFNTANPTPSEECPTPWFVGPRDQKGQRSPEIPLHIWRGVGSSCGHGLLAPCFTLRTHDSHLVAVHLGYCLLCRVSIIVAHKTCATVSGDSKACGPAKRVQRGLQGSACTHASNISWLSVIRVE